jgi:hypothetical protein
MILQAPNLVESLTSGALGVKFGSDEPREAARFFALCRLPVAIRAPRIHAGAPSRKTRCGSIVRKKAGRRTRLFAFCGATTYKLSNSRQIETARAYYELEKAVKTIRSAGAGRRVGAVFRFMDRDMDLAARILDKLRQSPFSV